MESLIRANIHFLDQAERLLGQLDERVYAEPCGRVFGASIGQHLRHCLDHYSSFLRGLALMKVDYDHRERDTSVESSIKHALAELDRLKVELLKTASQNSADVILVKMDCGGGDQECYQSTLGRELQFLASHTVHHYAMMNGMCREQGISVEEGFGIAPSTLRHRELASAS